MITGYGGVQTGDPALDALGPAHAFRAPATGEFGWELGGMLNGAQSILTDDLGVLPGGLHSFPRAMSQAGAIVGYSDSVAVTILTITLACIGERVTQRRRTWIRWGRYYSSLEGCLDQSQLLQRQTRNAFVSGVIHFAVLAE